MEHLLTDLVDFLNAAAGSDSNGARLRGMRHDITQREFASAVVDNA
jgi:hypothetical protein